MILSFLLIFAFLTLAVVKQLESRLHDPAAPAGRCPGCQGRVAFDWIICPRCKELLQRRCDSCGEQLSVCHHYCTGCGTQQLPGLGEVSACV
jgi:predicted amidophosphoribosyltransferase